MLDEASEIKKKCLLTVIQPLNLTKFYYLSKHKFRHFSKVHLRKMIGVLAYASARVATYIFSKPQYKNGITYLPSYLWANQLKTANFTSFIPRTNSNYIFNPILYQNESNFLLKTNLISAEQVRTVTKFSWKKGKRKSVKAVRARFFRLHWGIWIRTIAGRHSKLWKKSRSRRNFLQQHVFCNATQSRLLDTMVSKFWRKPKYYIDDPYECYHKRENFPITRKKPWRPDGVDYE